MKSDPAFLTLQRVHDTAIFRRRVRVLAEAVARVLPRNASVLDVGCGDGSIDSIIMEHRPDVKIVGIDTYARPGARIPVTQYVDQIPYPDQSFDAVMLIDVLHHTSDPQAVLTEATRVAKSVVVIKDHTREGFLANLKLRLMDWVGNRAYGVVLPYNYWTEAQWAASFSQLGLRVESRRDTFGLYPFPVNLVFERKLHLLVTLSPPGAR